MSGTEPRITRILFEPWALGDSIIAASAARLGEQQWAVACSPKWHAIIRSACRNSRDVPLLSSMAAYAGRSRRHGLVGLRPWRITTTHRGDSAPTVYSIRGDPRDWLLARRHFPRSVIEMRGWIPFVAGHSRVLDYPFRWGLRPVRNRYRMWADALSVPWEDLVRTYRVGKDVSALRSTKVVIHLGAQWRSKQYPRVQELSARLRDAGASPELVAGPRDALPRGLAPEGVRIVADEALVECIRSAELVLTNDSGPMHVSAFVGRLTFVPCRTANIEYWMPPGLVVAIPSKRMPGGYSPLPDYRSDQVLVDEWPSPEEVVGAMERTLTKRVTVGED